MTPRPPYRFDAALVRAHVPPELQARRQWVGWAYVWKRNGWTKVPKRVDRGAFASSTDPATWGTFDDAIAAAARFGYAGVGYVFAEDDPYVGVDVDDCFDAATGAIAPWAAALLDDVNTYAERSPSLAGAKAIARSTDAATLAIGAGSERRYLPDVPDANVLVASSERYFTLTGHRLDDYAYAIEDRTEVLARWRNELLSDAPAATATAAAPPEDSDAGPVDAAEADGSAVAEAARSMLAIRTADGADGSRRLYAYACRAVEHGLGDGDAVRAIRAATLVRPFPAAWSDADVVRRLRQAERRVNRGSATPAASAGRADADETPSEVAAARLRRRGSYRPMPLDPFPRTLRSFVEASARVKDIDPALVALPVLAVASASVGNARRLRLRGDYAPPAVLWPVAVAASGDGKSPGFDAAMRPLVAAQGDAARQHAEAVAAYREAVAEWKALPKADRGEGPPPPEPMRHLYISDATTEAVAVRLAETPRGLLCAVDEFAGLVKAFNAYKSGGGGGRESWLAFYDARAAKIDRKTAVPPTVFIPRAFVAVTGTIQPTTLRDTLTPEMVGCGFAARLLLTMPPARERAWLDDDVPAAVTNAYAELIAGLRNLSHAEGEADDGPAIVRPSGAAMDRWRAWWRECERDRAASADPAIRALIPKVRDAAARLALVFHCCASVDGTPGVSAELLDDASMAAGVRLARWFFDEGRRVYAMLAGDAHDDAASRLAEWVGRRPGGSTTVRDVARHLREYPTAASAAQALDALARAGLGAWHYRKPGPAGGHPTRTFTLAADADEGGADGTDDGVADEGDASASASSAAEDLRGDGAPSEPE